MEYVWIAVAFLVGFAGTYMWFSQKLKTEKLQWNAEQEALLKELREEIIDTEKEKEIAEAKEVELRLEMNTLNQKLEHEIEEKGKAMIEVAKLQTRIKGYEEQVSEIEALRKKIEEERNSRIEFEKKTAALESDLENAQKMLLEEKKRLEEVKEQMKQEFAIIANKVLKENSEEFSQHSKKNIGDLISPLKERIERFEKRVEDTYEKGRKDQLELHDEFKKIYNLSVQLDKDAKNLTKALKSDSKQQGNWGEVVLERILEESGLVKGQEYQIQASGENVEGKVIRPDVVIQLPEDKFLIIDSKVSLTAYQEYVGLEEKDARERALKRHVDSVKKHVKELSEKNYPSIKDKNTPDFVLMFLPIEPAFAAAIQADHSIFNYAWERRVVIVSPTTLLATLRTIESIWRQEKQTRNALDIASQAGSLYDKFVGFTEDLDKIGNYLDKTQKSYEDAKKKLSEGRGNLVGQVEKLKTMGAKAQKSINQKLLEE
jgi:DNA recombination protein RmuC